MIEIGKLFNIEKGSLQSSKCTPGQYSFITAGEEWKTHIEYTHDCEALVFAMAASGSLGRTHYVNGKFIASDPVSYTHLDVYKRQVVEASSFEVIG